MRKLLRFILLRMVFSIWETLRNILSSSFSLSSRASRVEADPCIRLEVRLEAITIKKQAPLIRLGTLGVKQLAAEDSS